MARIFRQRRIIITIAISFSLIVLLMLSVLLVRAATFALLVDTTADTVAVDGDCSLREAILVVNSGVGSADCPLAGGPADLVNDDFEIRFDTGGAIPAQATIQLTTELPAITSTLDIRGFNTVQDLTHRVTLAPSIPGTVATGLRFEQDGTDPAINASNSGVFGLTFDGFGIGIQVNNVSGVQIGRDGGTTDGLRNYLINGQYGVDVLGTDTDGTVISNNSIGIDEAGNPAGNDFDGIWVRADAQNTIIGGSGNPDFGNIIGSNGRHGINVGDVDTIDIINNIIGLLSDTSNLPRGNGQRGIDVSTSTSVNIQENTIGFNSLGGIRISNAPNTTFISNSIGVLPGTTTNVGNSNVGVLILSSNNSQFSGAGSTVAYSGSSGIVIQNSVGVAVRDTLTYSNALLGIDLGSTGVLPNDPGDGDTGANNSQNYPVFSLAATNGAVTGTALSINGNLPTGAGSYQLIFYVNNTCDASGFGEGNAFLLNGGSPYTLSTTSGEFSALLNGIYNVGEFITAIAISPTGDTSEFAECIEITDNVLIASFVPSATTIVAGESVFFDNTSTGVITDTRWFIDGGLVSTTYDLLQIFNTPGTYNVELEVENDLGLTDRTAPVTITVLAPTSTPTLTPSPTLMPSNTPVNTAVPTINTAIPTNVPTAIPTTVPSATSVPSVTATTIPSSTVVPSATATTIPSSTPVPSATATPIPSATATLIPSATATTIPSSTPVPSDTATTVPSPTLMPTETTTPALEVTVEGLDADSMSIVVVNSGLTDAQNLLVQEQLRSGVEYRATNLGEPICTEVGGLVSCRLGTLGAGQSTNVDITVQTNGESPDSGVTIVSADGITPQIIDEPYIIKVGNPPVAPPGSEITYTIRVINPTTETASDMVIQDVMPDIIEILDASATEGDLEIDGQNITLSLDELGAGERVTLTIQARVSDDDEAVEAIINTACVTSSSNPSPNCAVMSFLAVNVLPNTGQASWLMIILRWSMVLGMSTLMFTGIALLYLRLKNSR